MLLLIQKYIKNLVCVKAANSVNVSKRKHKNQINHYNKQRRVLMGNPTVCQSKLKPIVEPRQVKLKTICQAPTHWLKFYEEAVIESEARTAVVQLKSEAQPSKIKVREKSRECHNHKPQPFPDPKQKMKPTNLNKHKTNKRTKSTKISSLFPKRGNRNTKRTEKHKNKMTHGKTGLTIRHAVCHIISRL